MTAIERTAYPTFGTHSLHQRELDDYYTPTQGELQIIQAKLRRNSTDGSTSSGQSGQKLTNGG
jgi:hypothetical protein